MGTVALVALAVSGVRASAASADPLSMTFTEARANVGEQLFDDPLFSPPAAAPFEAAIDPGSGAITGGKLQVPQFTTHITHPFAAAVAVDFEIGVISGNFNPATGILTLSGTAGGTLTSEGHVCTIATDPAVLTLSTAGGSGGTTNPRSGSPFAHGLTGAGAIAGEWEDMSAIPVGSGDNYACEVVVQENIEGPGGVWLYQKGDVTPPDAPRLTGTIPASPGPSGSPRILGSAEAGSKVSLYAGPSCAGTPVASDSAAKLGSTGISVKVAPGTTTFSATATDAAGNTSACSAPISYTRAKTLRPRQPKPAHACIVPKLVGRTLARAKVALSTAHCRLGTVRKPKWWKGSKKRRVLVVKSSSPRAGAKSPSGKVDLRLGPKPRKARH